MSKTISGISKKQNSSNMVCLDVKNLGGNEYKIHLIDWVFGLFEGIHLLKTVLSSWKSLINQFIYQ